MSITRTKSNVAIAAAITSKARIKLYNAQESVIKNNGRLLYSDTDSIIAAYKRKVDNEKHGEVFWNVDKKDTKIKKALFIKPKMYGLVLESGEEIIKIKGFNQKNISFKELEDIFKNNTTIELKDFTFIDKKNISNKKETINKIYMIKDYDKRKFKEDFKNTDPYEFDGCSYF